MILDRDKDVDMRTIGEMQVVRGVLLAILLLMTTRAVAFDNLGTLYPQISVLNDYRYDGLSNSNRGPAIQASLYLHRADGFYGGLWTSSVDYGYPESPSFEIDIYAGHNWDLGNTRFSVEGMASLFPDQPDAGPAYDFFQGKIKLGRTFRSVSLQGTAAWSPDGSYGAGETWRVANSILWRAKPWLDFSSNYGTILSEYSQDRKFWDAGLTLKLKAIAIDFRYSDTDLEKYQCFYTDWCEPSMIGKITWNVPIFGFRS